MSRAGEFEVITSSPYPVWCEVSYHGQFLARFSHNELSDLHYAVEKAMQEAKIKLGDRDSQEV